MVPRMSTPTPAHLQRQFRKAAAHRAGRGAGFKVLVVVAALAWLVILTAIAQRLTPALGPVL